ncbi:MAG: hypothetical protein WCR61_06260 [Bacteroidales bacterium]
MKTLKKALNMGVLLTILSFILTISSCDKVKEMLTVSITTSIEGNIPLQVGTTTQGSVESRLPATKASMSYNVNHNISIADNSDLKPYLSKIKEIDIKSIKVEFTGLKAGETINFITISVTGVGELASITNVTSTNNIFSPTISSSLLSSVSKDVLNNKKITVNIKGETNGPLGCFVNLKMDSKVKAQALD